MMSLVSYPCENHACRRALVPCEKVCGCGTWQALRGSVPSLIRLAAFIASLLAPRRWLSVVKKAVSR